MHVGPGFLDEMDAFKRIVGQLSTTCSLYPTHPTCLWYKLDDLSFNRLIKDKYAHDPGFVF